MPEPGTQPPLPARADVAALLMAFPELAQPSRLSPERRSALLELLHALGFLRPLQREGWDDAADALLADPERIGGVDAEEACALLTRLVRRDRFFAGELEEAAANGCLAALFGRLGALLSSWPDP